MALRITDHITTTSPLDTYPTHLSTLGKGGYREVADIEERDDIPLERRSEGMMVYVQDEGKIYILEGGLENADWGNFDGSDNHFLGLFDTLDELEAFEEKNDDDEVVFPVDGQFALVRETGKFYIFNDNNPEFGAPDHDPEFEARWEALKADAEYKNEEATTVTVGGIEEGSTFEEGISLDELLTRMLYPFVKPVFTAFDIGVTTPLEVGQALSDAATVTWTTTEPDNVEEDSITILDVDNGNAEVAANLANSGNSTIDLSAIVSNEVGKRKVGIVGVDTEENEFSAELEVEWQNRIYFGESEDEELEDTDGVTGLRASVLTAGVADAGKLQMAAGGYKYVAIPASFGDVNFIAAQSGLEVVMEDTPEAIEVTNAHGLAQSYNVFRSKNKLNGVFDIVLS